MHRTHTEGTNRGGSAKSTGRGADLGELKPVPATNRKVTTVSTFVVCGTQASHQPMDLLHEVQGASLDGWRLCMHVNIDWVFVIPETFQHSPKVLKCVMAGCLCCALPLPLSDSCTCVASGQMVHVLCSTYPCVCCAHLCSCLAGRGLRCLWVFVCSPSPCILLCLCRCQAYMCITLMHSLHLGANYRHPFSASDTQI